MTLNPTTRGTSFGDPQTHQPNKPVDGRALDVEIDRLHAALNDLKTLLSIVVRADGQLNNRTVSSEKLTDEAKDSVGKENADAAKLSAMEASASSVSVTNWAAAIDAVAEETIAVANGAKGQQSDTARFKRDAENAAGFAVEAQNASEGSAEDAENWANLATQEANRAQFHEQYAFAWAEWLGGPVEAAIPGDPDFAKAYDDGYWSSKWWALKAMAEYSIWAKFYLGPHDTPPTTMPDGKPLRAGAIYLDTTTNTMMFWDGADWRELNSPVPQASLHLNLVYVASQDQTVFDLTVPDIYGETYDFGGTAKPHAVLVDGHEIVRDDTSGTLGDYNVDYVASTVTLLGGVDAGAVVTVRVYADASELRPGAVNIYSVEDITPDGVTVTFELRLAADSSLFSPVSANEMMVQVDGVMQRPGADFNVSTTFITFTEAPMTTAKVWMQWMEPSGVILLDGTFLQLQDTPASYTGDANKLPFVAPAETGLTFRNAVESDITDLDKYTKAEVDDLITQTMQWVADNFSVAIYASMDGVDLLPGSLGLTYSPLQNYDLNPFADNGIVSSLPGGTLLYPYEGIYQVNVFINIEHDSSNQGRETFLRVFDVTGNAPQGEGVTIGIGRNQTATIASGSFLLEVTALNKNHEFRIEIGGGSSVSVSSDSVTYEAHMISEWREIIPTFT